MGLKAMSIKEQVVQIIVDHREARSGLIDELTNYEYETTTTHVTTNVQTAQLEVGDIICSDRVGIERKSCSDLVDTIANSKRELMRQMADLSRTFKRPLMILEGKTVFGLRNIHPEALRATMASISIGWGVPIQPTLTIEETAAQVVTIARKEQFKENRRISIPHTKRTQMTLPQRQTYVVTSIVSGLGPARAEALLKHFRSVQMIMNASIDELCSVDGIHMKTAENIREIIGSEYKS